jgi:cephalosporin hydroxylase
MAVLDSCHSRDHVLPALRSYAPLVTEGCYLVVADTLLGLISPAQAPGNRSKNWTKGDEPLTALQMYLRETDRFEPDPAIRQADFR